MHRDSRGLYLLFVSKRFFLGRTHASISQRDAKMDKLLPVREALFQPRGSAQNLLSGLAQTLRANRRPSPCRCGGSPQLAAQRSGCLDLRVDCKEETRFSEEQGVCRSLRSGSAVLRMCGERTNKDPRTQLFDVILLTFQRGSSGEHSSELCQAPLHTH